MISVFFRFSLLLVLVLLPPPPPSLALLLPVWLVMVIILFSLCSATARCFFFVHNVLIAFRCFAVDITCVLVYVRLCLLVGRIFSLFRLFYIYLNFCMGLFTLENAWACWLGHARVAFMRVCSAAEPLFCIIISDEGAVISLSIFISNRCWSCLFALYDDNKTKINSESLDVLFAALIAKPSNIVAELVNFM